MTPEKLAATYAKAFPDLRAWTIDEFAALLAQQNTFLFGQSESFAIIRVTADEAEIITIATDPAARRQGFARKALNAAHTQAKSVGAASVFLEVAEDNIAARSLYADMGYAQVGRRPRYYRRADTSAIAALILRYDLNSA